MPEPISTPLPADANPVPVSSLEDFLVRAKADSVPENMPETTLQVYNDAQRRLPNQCRLFHVASSYYDWPYEQRARVMACPSTFHLCKSLVFENTKWKQDETKPVDADRYWCVLVQYEGSVNITKLEKAVRERTGASRKGTHLRIAPAEKSHELTGFTNNGVSPVGMKTDLPILISSAIAELSENLLTILSLHPYAGFAWNLEPALLYLGAGHVDWKIALPVQALVEHWNAIVIDFS
ncbi:hypothetical protein BGZ82_011461 [Podila clonocystis]|nr:hypothetical protein BGZ82_011461 [Podila clonocystis]